jgi:L-threonylcarbamoyladenylate synthase
MERLKVDPHRPEREILDYAARLIRRSGVVAYPTETFYGLGADALDGAANKRIVEIKGREAGKAFPLIVADIAQIEVLSNELPSSVKTLAERFWPGPLTLVIPIRVGLSGALEGLSTAAVRVSGLPLARELARAAGRPLIATSANPSSGAPARTPEEIETVFSEGVDLLLDGGPTPGGKTSTIVDVTGDEPHLIRKGPIELEDVLKVLADAT